MMDLDVAYHTVFTKIVLFQAVAILPLLLFTIPCPPADVKAEFPPPYGLPDTRSRVISVPRYPTFLDLGFLLVIYFLDIIFLHPYTKEGGFLIGESNSAVVSGFFWVGSGALVLQFLAACAWSGIRTNWVAAERRHGLWHFTPWRVYYSSFILTGLGIGLPMFFKLGWLMISGSVEVFPIAWKILCYQYTSVKAW
jgi:hypothetical protein